MRTLTLDTLESLSDDETGMLIYILGTLFKTSIIEVEKSFLRFYRKDFLIQKVIAAREHVLPEGLTVYESLCCKLGI